MIDPKKVNELSEHEKWVCTVRWLNTLYSRYYFFALKELTAEEFIEGTDACRGCPYYVKCPSVAKEPYRPFVPIPINFRVLERFTGAGSVAGPVFSLKDNQRKDKIFLP